MNSRNTTRRTGRQQMATRVAAAWADVRYANRRLLELQLDPSGRRSR